MPFLCGSFLWFPAEGEHLICPGIPSAHPVPRQLENVLDKCQLDELTKRMNSLSHPSACWEAAQVCTLAAPIYDPYGTHLRPLRHSRGKGERIASTRRYAQHLTPSSCGLTIDPDVRFSVMPGRKLRPRLEGNLPTSHS